MIQDVLYMNGYGLYVWSSFVFTLSCFWILHSVIKLQYIKEQKKFEAKFESLDIEKIEKAKNKKLSKKF